MRPPIASCPCLFRPNPGVKWWLADASWQETARRASENIETQAQIPADLLLKSANRRLVFLLQSNSADTMCVIKAFPFADIRHKLKSKKYAFSEATNLQQARRQGVPVPKLYGWAEQGVMLKNWSAVILEHLEGQPFVQALMQAENDDRRADILDRCAALFKTLYTGGVNHIDLKPDALFFGTEQQADRIIDFQYCTFKATPNLNTLLAQAGHFIYWWEKVSEPDNTLLEEWIERLFLQLSISEHLKPKVRTTLESHRYRVPSIAERLRQ